MNDSINYKGKTYLVSVLIRRQGISIIVFGVLGAISFIVLSKGVSVFGLIAVTLAIISVLFYRYYSNILKLRKLPVSNNQPSIPVQQKPAGFPDTYTFKIAGISYHQNVLMKYKYTNQTRYAVLTPEPQNPHDPNAIAIYVDNELIGHVPKGDCTHVKNILFANPISDITVDLQTGIYGQRELVWGRCTIHFISSYY